MIKITAHIFLNPAEMIFTFIRSPGPGGQNVNKVASGVLLRFNVLHSTSLPEDVRLRLITLLGKKINAEGECVIKATRFRTQEQNKRDALDRLCHHIKHAAIIPKKRKKTKPTRASKERRLKTKKQHGMKKALRQGVS